MIHMVNLDHHKTKKREEFKINSIIDQLKENERIRDGEIGDTLYIRKDDKIVSRKNRTK